MSTSSRSAGRSGAQRPAWSRIPADEVSNAAAEAIDLAKAAGLILDDWQKWVLSGALGERADGTWSAFECALIVPRQNGKNAILEALELAGVVLFGDDMIVHTAHRADTTLEHFRRMTQYAEEFDDFARLVKHVSNKNGAEAIELKGGRRIRFVSRARNPGRGFSGSKVVFDEAGYGLSASVIGALIPTLATRPMAQVWYTSSAPKADSDVLHSVRRRGRGVDSDDLDERLFYAEWGNDGDVDLDDMDAAARANPGLGVRISEEFVRAERRLMIDTPAEFARERMGVAEEPVDPLAGAVIPLDVWDLLDQPAEYDKRSARLALDVAPDREWSTLGVAGRRDDGRVQLRLVAGQPGIDWIADAVAEVLPGLGVKKVTVHRGSPAESVVPALVAVGADVDVMSTGDLAAATQQLVDAAKGVSPSVRHCGEPHLRRALQLAQTKPHGDGGVVFSRRSTAGNITELMSVTMAHSRLLANEKRATAWVFSE